jgi:hypothetical protein
LSSFTILSDKKTCSFKKEDAFLVPRSKILGALKEIRSKKFRIIVKLTLNANIV